MQLGTQAIAILFRNGDLLVCTTACSKFRNNFRRTFVVVSNQELMMVSNPIHKIWRFSIMKNQWRKNSPIDSAFRNAIIVTTTVLTTATASFAQISPLPSIPRPNPDQLNPERLIPRPIAGFTCAPHLETYVVRPLDQRQGKGIRCVKRSEGRIGLSRIPAIAWYGEGDWQGSTYRHLGHAFYDGPNLVGAAADFKEVIHNNFPYGTLKLEIVSPNTIRVTGAWNEVWTKVNRASYRPLPRPTDCGRFFDQYKVTDLDGTRSGEGLRCALKDEHVPSTLRGKVSTWFGNGFWGTASNTYSHVGTFSLNGYGASDLCHSPFGPICNTFGWGSLKFTSTATGYTVTGAWSEKWER